MLDKNIDTIIFDFGGVLLDLDKQACVDAFVALGCHDIANLIDNYRQKGLFLLFEEGQISNEEFFTELKKLVGPNVTQTQIEEAYKQFLVGLPQYKLDLILRLHKQYKILLLSNINQFVFEYCAEKYFNANGYNISDYFDKLYLSYQMGVCKPDEQIFRQMIEGSKLIPQNCLYLDDGIANIEMGKKLGFNSYHTKIGEDFSYLFE